MSEIGRVNSIPIDCRAHILIRHPTCMLNLGVSSCISLVENALLTFKHAKIVFKFVTINLIHLRPGDDYLI